MKNHLNNKVFYEKKAFIVTAKAFVITSLIFSLFLGIGFTMLRKTVTIVCDGQEIQVSTLPHTVARVLERQGIQIEEEDRVTPGLNEKIEGGMRIIVHRAFQIQLIDGGQEQFIFTAANTVQELLDSMEIEMGEMDKVQPDLSASIQKGDEIKIIRVTEDIVTSMQDIPYQTIVKYNESLNPGESKKVQEGQNGIKEVQYKVLYEDGVEIARELLQETIHREVVNEVIEKAALNYIVTSRGEVRRYKQVYTMVATAYDAGYESTGKRPGDPYYGITRSGTRVRPGVVAVDPKVIPLGTKLYIESTDGTKSYGFASAEDTGSAIKGNRIDLYFESREEALRYGRRVVKVYVLE